VRLQVECGSGCGEPVPLRFGRPGAMQEVAEWIDRWLGRDHSYFRVRTAQGVETILRRDERSGEWRIHFLDARSGR